MTTLPTPARTLAVALLALAPGARADVDFPSFSSTAGLTFVGSAGQSGSFLRLVPAALDQAGAAWFDTKQNVTDGFATQFFVLLGTEVGGDGFAFVIQNTSLLELGGSGCELGYDGIANSIAIEFDTFGNDVCAAGQVDDPDAVHVSVHTLGTSPNSAAESASLGAGTTVTDFSDGGVHLVRIEYVPGALKVFVDDFSTPAVQVQIDIAATLALDAGRAWIGFTGATGGLFENHDLVAWTFTEQAFGGSGNTPPAAPQINEPGIDFQVVNPTDVHMETSPMSDPDVGDQHLCSDWQIWTLAPAQRVWSTQCIGGVERLHTHLADGQFEGSHAGQSELFELTDFVLRVRHRDDSGDALTEWGPWSERFFSTGSASQVFPLELDDVADLPAPAWARQQDGSDLVLPAGNAAVRLESAAGDLLLELAGFDGVVNVVTNPAPLLDHEFVRVRVSAGSNPLSLDESNLSVADEHCDLHTILLPEVQLAAGGEAIFWVSAVGATYFGSGSQTEPDFSSLARSGDVPWVLSEPGYAVEVFASGFQLPVHIAFLPDPGDDPDDPFFYVTELQGTIKVVTRDGSVSDYATNLLDFTPTGAIPGSGEQGLGGIVVDPGTGDVYAGMLRDSAFGGNHFPKVVRFVSLDGGLTAGTQTTILDMPGETQGQSHFISNFAIHPDGKLIVHMGDGFDASTALDLTSYRGKILRMNLDGSAADDNPFYNAGDGIDARDYVFAFGVRNPFGGAWRAEDGLHYQVENGPSTDRFGQVVPGRSFGWDGSEASMQTFALHNWVPSTGPVDLVFIQPETFGGSGFPEGKQGHAFVTESGGTYATGPQVLGKKLSEFVLDASGALVSGPTTFMEYAGDGKASASALAAGPDGIYMADLYADAGTSPTDTGANILRIRFVGDADCNGNGINDGCDILSGTSADVDGNGIPDECDCAGTRFCSSTPNSTGSPALIATAGDCAVADNMFSLTAGPVPNQPGVFFYSTGQVSGGAGTPFYNGLQCVGGAQIHRLDVVTATGGTASYPVDFTVPPTPAGTITPGSTWNFQFWFRDPAAGGQFANLSDGIEVTFH